MTVTISRGGEHDLAVSVTAHTLGHLRYGVIELGTYPAREDIILEAEVLRVLAGRIYDALRELDAPELGVTHEGWEKFEAKAGMCSYCHGTGLEGGKPYTERNAELPNCDYCGGTGRETEEGDDTPELVCDHCRLPVVVVGRQYKHLDAHVSGDGFRATWYRCENVHAGHVGGEYCEVNGRDTVPKDVLAEMTAAEVIA